MIQEAHAAAAGSTTQILNAAQDEISVAVSAVFGN
ncbi:PE domain-containing protein, partial [Mycobacterium sp. THU-M116]